MRDTMVIAALANEVERKKRALALVIRDWPQTLILLVGIAGFLLINYYGYWEGQPDADGNPTYRTVAWPWYVPLGSTVAFVFGFLLARRRPQPPEAASV